MTTSIIKRLGATALLAAAILLATAFTASAQKLNIGYVYPAGGQQGTTFEVTVGGQNLRTVTGVSISGKGVTGEIVDNGSANGARTKRKLTGEQDNPQLAEKVRVRITVDPKAEVGLRDLRLSTASSYSNRLFFSIDQLREVNERQPNNDMKSATPGGKIPVLFNGQILPGEKDFMSFEAKGGVDLVCTVKARALMPYLADAVPGWFQAVLTLLDSKGREVAYCDDYRFNPDPTIICRTPADDTYTLVISDAIWRGREDFVYRVAVGELPFITSISPMGGKANAKTKVKLEGVNLSSKSVTIKPPRGFSGIMQITDKNKGLISNPVDFEVSESHELTNAAKAGPDGKSPVMLVKDGDAVNGVIDSFGRSDWYAVDVTAGQAWTFEVMARRLGSPLDAKLTLIGLDGKAIKTEDDTDDPGEPLLTHFADPVMAYRFQKPGRYYLRLVDNEQHYGPDYAYRFHAGLYQPEFDLRIDPSSISIPQGSSAVLKISAIRKLNFNGDIAIDIHGLPQGYRVSGDKIRQGEDFLRLTVTAPSDAKQGPLDLSITGTATAGDRKVTVTAMPAEEMMQAFYYTHLVPTNDFKVNVSEPLPINITPMVDLDKPVTFARNATTPLKVHIERREGFDEPVQITLTGGAPFFKMKPVTVEAGQTEAELEIECADRFGLPKDRTQPLIFIAQAKPQQAQNIMGKLSQKVQNASMTAYLPAITALIPAASQQEQDQLRGNREQFKADKQNKSK